MPLPSAHQRTKKASRTAARAPDDGAEPLRILMLARDPRSGGGVVSYVDMLMRTLAGRVRWQHLIIGRRPGEAAGSSMGRLLRDYLTFWRHVRSGEHDLIHLNPSFIEKALARDLAFLAIAQWLSPLPQVVFMHGWDWAVFEQVQRSPWKRWLVGRLLARADRVVVLGTPFKQALQSIGVPAERISVTTTMFSGAELGPDTCRRDTPPPTRILFLSRVVLEKGILESIEAVHLLLTRGHEVELIVAGDGPDLDAARHAAQAVGVADRVRFLGYVRGEAKAEVLRDAHVYLLPSVREGCPVALLEAMACGMPVVATAVGGIPEVMVSDVNGLLITRGEPGQIADAIECLITDPARWQRFADANRAAAHERFEATPVSKQMLSLYEGVKTSP